MQLDWKLEKLMLDLLTCISAAPAVLVLERKELIAEFLEQLERCKSQGHWADIERQTRDRYECYRSVALPIDFCEKAAAYYALHLLSEWLEEGEVPSLMQRSFSAALENGRTLSTERAEYA